MTICSWHPGANSFAARMYSYNIYFLSSISGIPSITIWCITQDEPSRTSYVPTNFVPICSCEFPRVSSERITNIKLFLTQKHAFPRIFRKDCDGSLIWRMQNYFFILEKVGLCASNPFVHPPQFSIIRVSPNLHKNYLFQQVSFYRKIMDPLISKYGGSNNHEVT